MTASISIRPFESQYRSHFERLNRIWLEGYGLFEDIDATVLTNPEKHILDPGGEIYFAFADQQIVGTVALVPMPNGEWELTKLAVDPKFRGHGIGKAIMLHIHQAALEKGLSSIILYSQTMLEPAIRLYRKLGYYEVPVDQLKYARCDIKMEIPLTGAFSKEMLEIWKKRFSEGPDLLEKTLKNIPKEIYNWQGPDGKWTIQQNIIHLADSEANSYIRLRRGLAESGKAVLGYDQEAWASNLFYEKQSADDAIQLFRLMRKMSSALIENIPDESWTRNTINHSENGTMTLYDWLRIYAHHNHTGQITRVYKLWTSLQ